MQTVHIKINKIKVYFTTLSLLFMVMLLLFLAALLLTQFSIVHHDVLIKIVFIFIGLSLLLPFFIVFRRDLFLILEDNQLIYGSKNLYSEFEDDAYFPIDTIKKIKMYHKLFYREIVIYTDHQTITIDTLNYRKKDFKAFEQWLEERNLTIETINADSLLSPNQCLQCRNDIEFQHLIKYIFKPKRDGFRCSKCNHQIFDLNIYIAITFIVTIAPLWLTNKTFTLLGIVHNVISFSLVYLLFLVLIALYVVGYVWKYRIK